MSVLSKAGTLGVAMLSCSQANARTSASTENIHVSEKLKEQTVDYREQANFQAVRVFDAEVEIRPSCIPMEEGRFLRLSNPESNPIRLGISNATGTVEVLGWGLSVPAEKLVELHRFIGRRFLQLYSKSLIGGLTEQDEACLDVVSDQVDYRAYIASRAAPRYREATLIRHEPLLIQFQDAKNVRLSPSLASSLHLFEPQDRFGAWFTTTPDGEITAIEYAVTVEDVDHTQVFEKPEKVQFPDSLKKLLPPPQDLSDPGDE